MRMLRSRLGELRRYPSAIAGLGIICGLIILAVYALASMPYAEAVRLWRGGEGVWTETPRNAMPAWVNILPGNNLPRTIIVDSRDNPSAKVRTDVSAEMTELSYSLPFQFTSDGFPKEISVFFVSSNEDLRPYVSVVWRMPDGGRVTLAEKRIKATETLRLSLDDSVRQRLGQPAEIGLFGGTADQRIPAKGEYALEVTALVFEKGADIDTRLVVYGQVHGLAGTDHRRRDITVALLWGTPTALAFGLLAAVGSTTTTMTIAASGAWFGRWVDGLIQRITEVNLILPVLPILIMIGTLHSRSIWVMLGAVIVLGIFGSGIKVYRSMFLQVREAPYIEAARAYGASPLRIVFLYMIPRVIPVLVPQFVVLIPGYVFLEATLAVLGLGDPILPTWGKVLNDAFTEGALLKGYYYWVLAPSVLLILTGLGFAMLGFALDRIFNPRLREL
jgi:peptide/nickel transport system permease protein